MRLRLWFSKPEIKPETAGERAERMRKALKRNPATGELLITRRYRDAVIDHILEHWKKR